MEESGDRRPVYMRLRDVLAAKIASSAWPPGSMIPAETEIADENGIAVGTARKALDLLESDGLLERIQGSGTFVRKPDFKTAVIRSIQCHGSAGDPRSPAGQILRRKKIAGSREVTDALRLPEKSPVIHLLRLRTFGDEPVLVERIWLDAVRFAPILVMEDLRPPLLYPVYETLCGAMVARTEETVRIGVANAEDEELLRLGRGEPVVMISRLSFGYDERPIEWRCSRGLGRDFCYEVEIR